MCSRSCILRSGDTHDTRPDVWLGDPPRNIDELVFDPLSKTGAELLCDVFSKRHELGSTLVTSNLPFDKWSDRSQPISIAARFASAYLQNSTATA